MSLAKLGEWRTIAWAYLSIFMLRPGAAVDFEGGFGSFGNVGLPEHNNNQQRNPTSSRGGAGKYGGGSNVGNEGGFDQVRDESSPTRYTRLHF